MKHHPIMKNHPNEDLRDVEIPRISALREPKLTKWNEEGRFDGLINNTLMALIGLFFIAALLSMPAFVGDAPSILGFAVSDISPPDCTSSWNCTSWSLCHRDGTSTRTCIDVNGCRVATDLRRTSRPCANGQILPDPTLDDEVLETEELAAVLPITPEKEVIMERPTPEAILFLMRADVWVIFLSTIVILIASVALVRELTGVPLRIVSYKIRHNAEDIADLQHTANIDESVMWSYEDRYADLEKKHDKTAHDLKVLGDVMGMDRKTMRRMKTELGEDQKNLDVILDKRREIEAALEGLDKEERELGEDHLKIIETRQKLNHQKENAFLRFERANIPVPKDIKKPILEEIKGLQYSVDEIRRKKSVIKRQRQVLQNKKQSFVRYGEKIKKVMADRQRLYDMAEVKMELTQEKYEEAKSLERDQSVRFGTVAESYHKQKKLVDEEKTELVEAHQKEAKLIKRAHDLTLRRTRPAILRAHEKEEDLLKDARGVVKSINRDMDEIRRKTRIVIDEPKLKGKGRYLNKRRGMIKKLKRVYKH